MKDYVTIGEYTIPIVYEKELRTADFVLKSGGVVHLELRYRTDLIDDIGVENRRTWNPPIPYPYENWELFFTVDDEFGLTGQGKEILTLYKIIYEFCAYSVRDDKTFPKRFVFAARNRDGRGREKLNKRLCKKGCNEYNLIYKELKADAMWWVCLMEHPDLRR